MVDLREITEFLASRLAARGIEIEKLILFGSRAMDIANEESDFDFAVISRSFEKKDLYERGEITAMPVAETIWEFNVPIDLIGLTPSEFHEKDRLICASLKMGKTLISN